MAASNSLSSHLEDLRSRNPQSPGEGAYSGYTTPVRYSGSFMPSHTQPFSGDARASLQRRFTTDSGKAPLMTPIGQMPSQAVETVDMSATVCSPHSDIHTTSDYLQQTHHKVQAVSFPPTFSSDITLRVPSLFASTDEK